MHIRRLLKASTTALATASVVLLAGCSTSAPSTPAPAAPAGPTTLTVWYMSGSLPEAAAAGLKKAFEAAHQGVTVDYQVQQWDGIGEKLTTALAGNEPPD